MYLTRQLAGGDDIFSRYGYVAYFFRPESQRNLMRTGRKLGSEYCDTEKRVDIKKPRPIVLDIISGSKHHIGRSPMSFNSSLNSKNQIVSLVDKAIECQRSDSDDRSGRQSVLEAQLETSVGIPQTITLVEFAQ